MKTLKLSEVAEAVCGKITADTEFTGVYTDSRKPLKGGLFVALEGERFDGHDFIENAEKDGAAAVMCRKKTSANLPVLYVEDVNKALLALGGYYRSLFDIKLIGLTGSVGKTTTKELTALAAATKYDTVKTQGNLNNEIGMPMTLFTIEPETGAAVVEMGMNHPGEIAALTRAAKPDLAIITNIGVSHIENLGSRENILKAKLEILQGMKKGSPLILNGDNDLLKTVKNDDFNIIFFAIENEDAHIRAVDIKPRQSGTEFNILCCQNKYPAFVPVPGLHNVYDALAAFGAAVAAGADPQRAAASFENYVPSGMRQKTVEKQGIVFIEDCYNASPDSVKAGLEALMGVKAQRHIAVLGDMLELGDYSPTAHTLCGEYAAEKKVDILFAYGEKSRCTGKAAGEKGVSEVYFFDECLPMGEKLLSLLRKGDCVLFKASRGMKLENAISYIYEKLENNVKGGNDCE